MNKSYYTIEGEPHTWDESTPKGPFKSITAAKKAIREDIKEAVDEDDALAVNQDTEQYERVAIIQIVEMVQPKVKVTATVSVAVSNDPPLMEPETEEDTDIYYKEYEKDGYWLIHKAIGTRTWYWTINE